MNGELIDHFTGCYYLHPIKCEDGFTYEKQFIERWLKKESISPYTRYKMSFSHTDDISMKERVEKFLLENPEKIKEQYVETFDISELLENKDFEKIMKTINFSIHDFTKTAYKNFLTFPFEVRKYIVDNFIDINEFHEDGYNLILLACEACKYEGNDNYRYIEYLINKGVKINLEPTGKYTHFGESHEVSSITCLDIFTTFAEETEENIQILHLLLNKGVNIYTKEYYGQTPIMTSLSLSFTKIILESLKDSYERWKYLNVKDGDGENVLHNLLFQEDCPLDLVKYLVSLDKNLLTERVDGKTPLSIACQYTNNLDIIKEYIDKIEPIDIFFAVRGEKFKILELILKHHNNPLYKERLVRICSSKEKRYAKHNNTILKKMIKSGFLTKEEISSLF